MVRMLLGLQESVDARLSEYAVLWTNVTGDPVMEDMLDGRHASIVFVLQRGFNGRVGVAASYCVCSSWFVSSRVSRPKFTQSTQSTSGKSPHVYSHERAPSDWLEGFENCR